MIPSLETERMWARPVLLAVNFIEVVASAPRWRPPPTKHPQKHVIFARASVMIPRIVMIGIRIHRSVGGVKLLLQWLTPNFRAIPQTQRDAMVWAQVYGPHLRDKRAALLERSRYGCHLIRCAKK
jgi:hypothetical protein